MGRGEQFHCEQEPFGTNTVAICFISRKPLNWYLLKTIPNKQKLKLSNWIIIHLTTYVINSVCFNEYVFKILVHSLSRN